MPTNPTAPATFGEALLHALEQFTDPTTLGRTSPLATPYLLGHHLTPADNDARAHGRVLQRLIRTATAAISGDDADLHRAIIEERYCKGKSATAARQVDRIMLGKTQYFAHQKRAVARLEPLLLDQLNPTLRLEQPVLQTGDLIDRDRTLDRCLAALRQMQTVTLTGSGGVGKTSLGSKVAAAWGSALFWFTVRPGINDHLHSLLFELAYFCHLRGASWLWQELIANNGSLPAPRVPAIVRHTLAHLPEPPLLCIDEADLLLAAAPPADAQAEPPPDSPAQSLLQLLNSLRHAVPILVMGQRAALDADHDETLTGLSAPLSNVLLKQAGVMLPTDAQHQLHTYTAGNPQLLHLYIALHQSGESLTVLLDQLPHSPSLHFLLGRMLQRLTPMEIGVLMELAVFSTPAPADAWQQSAAVAAALTGLHTRHLVQQDQQGGVALLPAYRAVILAELPVEKLHPLHATAAAIYRHRGRYTLAAYHLRHTATPEQAVWFWAEHEEQEINRGQAYPALQLWRDVQREQEQLALSTPAREQVAIYCARLEKLIGDAAVAAADLRGILFKTPLLQVAADELAGFIANDRDDLTAAEQHFRRAIATGEQLVAVRLAHAYKGLGWRYRNERELEKARHSGLLAQYEVTNFQGEVALERREYDAAIAYLDAALALAEQVGHADGIAKTCNNLGRIATMIGRYAAAETYFDRAEERYRQIGKVTAFDGMVINRAFLWNLSNRHGDAVALLEHLLAAKRQQPTPPPPQLTALIYQNLAEALLGVERLADAEQAVQMAIAQEEIRILPDAYRTHGEIKLQQGFPEQAERLICHALDLIEQMETPDAYLAGYAWRALAQVYLAQGEGEKATAARAKAVECFAAINLPNEIERTERLSLFGSCSSPGERI